jgi:AraC-like DNA-binding protein
MPDRQSAFIKRFTRVLGAAPATYLKQLRLGRGHRLLAESRHKVLEIALACGYASEAAFSKAFKREYGVPPSELRKRRRAANSFRLLMSGPGLRAQYGEPSLCAYCHLPSTRSALRSSSG